MTFLVSGIPREKTLICDWHPWVGGRFKVELPGNSAIVTFVGMVSSRDPFTQRLER